MPTELDEISRHIIQLQIEEAAVAKEEDSRAQERLTELRRELAEEKDRFAQMKAKWENEKNAIGGVAKLREEIEAVSAEIERAERDYDLNKAAELKYGKLPALKKQLEEEEQQVESGKTSSLLRNKVTEDEIARIVERWTAFRYSGWLKGSGRNCCIWTRFCISVSSARMKRSRRSPKRSSVRVPVSPTPTARLVLSCSSARPVLVRTELAKTLARDAV